MKNQKKVKGIGTQTSMPWFQCFVLSIIVLLLFNVRKSLGSIKFANRKSERIARAIVIVNACAVSTWVTIEPDVITAINALITTYRNATPAEKVAAFRALKDAIQNDLLAPFQKAADLDADNAVAILRSGEFYVTVFGGKGKQQWSVSDTPVSGTIELTAQGSGSAWHIHNWYYSTDGVTWITLTPTTKSKTMVNDLPVAATAYFKHELTVKDVPQGMSQVISIIVR